MRAWLQVQSECSYGLKAAARLKGPSFINAEQQVSSEAGSRGKISKWRNSKKKWTDSVPVKEQESIEEGMGEEGLSQISV